MGIFSNAKPTGTETNEAHSRNHKETKELQIAMKEKTTQEHKSHTFLESSTTRTIADLLYMIVPSERNQ